MALPDQPARIGLLLSGGLDSAILGSRLLRQGYTVQPFYIRSDVVWGRSELTAVRRYLNAVKNSRLDQLVVLDLPLADLYRGHWSVTGQDTPDSHTPDEAVFLPGRNALLIIKAAIWCQLHGIAHLALAPLRTSPFADATDDFIQSLQQALNISASCDLQIHYPFGDLNKSQVMRLGAAAPLEHTFSCIAPIEDLHCGQCNKCGERRQAFAEVGRDDPTAYASQAPALAVP